MNWALSPRLARQSDLHQARAVAAAQAAAGRGDRGRRRALYLHRLGRVPARCASRTAARLAWLLALQAVILVVMGASQVGSSVGAARASGILDFHRVSPLTPAELTLGFFFGAPVREYVLFACTLPLSVLCLALGPRARTGSCN